MATNIDLEWSPTRRSVPDAEDQRARSFSSLRSLGEAIAEM
jgi:hypothetical protein